MIWLRRLAMYGVLVVVVGTVYGALAVLLPAQTDSTTTIAPPPPLQKVDVLTVSPRGFSETILLPGTVEAREDILLSAAISGIVDRVSVEEGDAVQQGEELFRIDQRVRQTELDDAQSTLALQEKNLERIRTLHERGNVTAQELDEAVTLHQQARHAVNRARVHVSLGIVTAPIEGIVDRVFLDEGEYAHEGSQLVHLLDLRTVDMVVGVPERFSARVQEGKTAHVQFDAFEDDWTGIVERVALSAHEGTNTFETTIVIDNPALRLRPGMIGRVRLEVRTVPDALLVPMLALVKRENGMVLFVEQDGVVEERPVEPGAVQGEEILVREGLAPGESVVVVGQQDLVHGQSVVVMKRMDSIDGFEPVVEVR